MIEIDLRGLNEEIKRLKTAYTSIDCYALLVEGWENIKPNVENYLNKNFAKLQTRLSSGSVYKEDIRKGSMVRRGVMVDTGAGGMRQVLYIHPLVRTGFLKEAITSAEDGPGRKEVLEGDRSKAMVGIHFEYTDFHREYPKFVDEWLAKRLGVSLSYVYTLDVNQRSAISSSLLGFIASNIMEIIEGKQ